MSNKSGGIGSFILGGIAGAAIGLLFAPRTGRDTREYIADRALEYWEQGEDMYESGVDRAYETYEQGLQRATEVSSQVRETFEDARGRITDVAQAAKEEFDALTHGSAKDAVADAIAEVRAEGTDAAETLDDVVEAAVKETADDVKDTAKKVSDTVKE